MEKEPITPIVSKFVPCPVRKSCGMMIHKEAMEVHIELNHPVDARHVDNKEEEKSDGAG